MYYCIFIFCNYRDGSQHDNKTRKATNEVRSLNDKYNNRLRKLAEGRNFRKKSSFR